MDEYGLTDGEKFLVRDSTEKDDLIMWAMFLGLLLYILTRLCMG